MRFFGSPFGVAMILVIMVAALLIVPMAFAAPSTMLDGSALAPLTVDSVTLEVVTVGYSMPAVADAQSILLKNQTGSHYGAMTMTTKSGFTLAQGLQGVSHGFGSTRAL